MDLGILGRVAIVGGSSRGLGKAIAERLASEGAMVTICSRNKSDLDQTQSNIAKISSPKNVIGVQADLTKITDIQRLVNTTLTEFGRIDILINNVGGPPLGEPSGLTDEQWETALKQNLMSGVRLNREVIPYMRQRQWGRIINLLSYVVREPVEGLVLSTTARIALMGYSKALANQVAPHNITVNSVLCGNILTDRLIALHEAWGKDMNLSVDQMLERTAKKIPMKRIGLPEDMGDLVAFLVSERAKYITGTSIPLDGGLIRGVM